MKRIRQALSFITSKRAIQPPPVCVFTRDFTYNLSSIIGLDYTQGSGPSADSSDFSLYGAGLLPVSGNITITPDSDFTNNFEYYNPDTAAYTSSSALIAYVTGTKTLNGFKVRAKAGLSAGNISGILTVSAANTVPFTLTCSGTISSAPVINEFMFTIKTDNSGVSANNQFTFPFNASDLVNPVSCFIYWGDGNVTYSSSNIDITHTYSAIGTYQISVSGTLPSIYFNGSGDCLKVLSIDNWGNINWKSFQNSFYGCANMVANYSDIPNTVNVENFAYAFAVCSLWNGNLNNMNVSNGKYFNSMFSLASIYNQPMNLWDMRKAETFYYMFFNAFALNQDISDWDIVNVANGDQFMGGKSIEFNTSYLDLIYNKWSLLGLEPNVLMNFGSIKYTASGTAGKNILIGAPNNWTIIDGGI
jgi:hypothetical protein